METSPTEDTTGTPLNIRFGNLPYTTISATSSHETRRATEEKEITPENSQVTQEPRETPARPASPDVTYQPKTPKFKVCSEDLDLHWSGSDSGDGDSDCVIEEVVGDEEAKDVFEDDEFNESSDDVFGESISDSLLARAVDHPHVGKEKSVRELSVGMMEALDGMDTLANFSVDEAHITKEPKRRKRKKDTKLLHKIITRNYYIVYYHTKVNNL